jgi:hypothetical protein
MDLGGGCLLLEAARQVFLFLLQLALEPPEGTLASRTSLGFDFLKVGLSLSDLSLSFSHSSVSSVGSGSGGSVIGISSALRGSSLLRGLLSDGVSSVGSDTSLLSTLGGSLEGDLGLAKRQRIL